MLQIPQMSIEDAKIERFIRDNFKSNEEILKAIREYFKIKAKRREDKILQQQLKEFQEGKISFGKIAENMNLSKDEVIEILDEYNIPLVNYDLGEDLAELNIELK